MPISTSCLFAFAPLFGADDVPRSVAFLAFAPFLYVAFLFVSRRLVGDIFKNASPAQSPKRLVPWSVGATFGVFLCGAILFPLVAANAISALPRSWFPDFASVSEVALEAAFPASVANQPNVENESPTAPKNNPGEENESPTETQNNPGEENQSPTETQNAPKVANEKNLATQHPLARLLIRSRSTPWAFETLLLCFFVAVIAAPFAEEFLFRVLLQGTFENYALEAVLPPPGTPRRPFADASSSAQAENADAPKAVLPDAPSATEFSWTDPTTPMERRAFYLRSAFAILVPAFIFGLIHAGAPETPEEARDPETLNRLFRTMLAAGLANVATLALGLLFLRRSTGATTGDVGLGPEFTYKAGRCFASLRRFALDFYRGVAAFAFIAPFVFGANAALRSLFPNAIVDPLPIFLFALAEGVVYWRIRRYATVVGMHVALNATSFVLLCAHL
ncbi:MAG: CPBP family intramembrane metalloprotease [Thermoguttaceae bacterium]|nr:CPBP family intramembrane metalloprotease [Thermoguttaceae bacterium]